MFDTHRLLIGSIGDDSHSVGMALLELAFRESGFYVENIGIMNRLEDFFLRAEEVDVILISCMNGHVDLYLKEFHYYMKQLDKKNLPPKLWYLGGNLSVRDSEESIVRKFRKMGFDYVSPKPVSFETIMAKLLKDLHNKGIKKKKVERLDPGRTVHITSSDNVDDTPLSDEEFHSIRNDVLDSWQTGKDVRTTDIKKNHLEPSKNMHHLITASAAGLARPLVQPRTGVAHIDDEIDILTYLRQNGLDVSSIQLDAASRKNMYDKALEGVMRTEPGKTSFLNGYPVAAHGVAGMEKILRAIDTPFQIRAGSPDHRLVYEIGLAGGASSLEGGFICYLYPYDKNTSPVDSLFYWKYVDKLADYYYRNFGVVINREYFGPLTCCLIEPVIPICINIAQAILSAKSGVRCISVGLAEQGNRSQDIAAIKTLDKMTRYYLSRHGLRNVTVSTVFHQYMAAFPQDIQKSRDLILNSSITGALAGASRIMTKTPVESHHIPTRQDNAEGLKLTYTGLLTASDTPVDHNRIKLETDILEREVQAIMTTIEELGKGSIARGTLKAFEKGILDIPFSPSVYNQNSLITARDTTGAIRFVNPERLPFDTQLIDFHKEKIQKRMIGERAVKTYEILERDLTRVWKNDIMQWPLDGTYLN